MTYLLEPILIVAGGGALIALLRRHIREQIDRADRSMHDKPSRAVRADYVIEVYGAPRPTWFAGTSDEQTGDELAPTTDADLAVRFSEFKAARAELRRLVNAYPEHSFRVGVMPRRVL